MEVTRLIREVHTGDVGVTSELLRMLDRHGTTQQAMDSDPVVARAIIVHLVDRCGEKVRVVKPDHRVVINEEKGIAVTLTDVPPYQPLLAATGDCWLHTQYDHNSVAPLVVRGLRYTGHLTREDSRLFACDCLEREQPSVWSFYPDDMTISGVIDHVRANPSETYSLTLRDIQMRCRRGHNRALVDSEHAQDLRVSERASLHEISWIYWAGERLCKGDTAANIISGLLTASWQREGNVNNLRTDSLREWAERRLLEYLL